MVLANIQTFLTVAHCRSLSEAADILNISQPTVTARLKQLEDDLGAPLVSRSKGIRNVELTPQGVEFIPLAERWIALKTETEGFAGKQFATPLTIASPDSLNLYLFQPFYKELAAPENALALRIRTHQSPEIFQLVENKEVDVGFAFHLSRSNGVVCTPLFSEKMVLLCSRNGSWPSGPVSPRDLDPRHELYLPWSQDLQNWHDSWWNPAVRPYLYVDNALLLALCMDNPNCWALCPTSVANTFLQEGKPLQVHTLAETPPNRVCYMLTNRYPHSVATAAAISRFQTGLRSYLASRAELTLL